MSEVRRILSTIEHGDPRATEQLLPLVYDGLRKLAAQRLSPEKPGQTLDATALLHEAYLRLVGGTPSLPGMAAVTSLRRTIHEKNTDRSKRLTFRCVPMSPFLGDVMHD